MNLTATAKRNVSPLAENSFLRYVTFIVLYFSQGIPEGITLFAIPAWMAMNGKSVVEIAAYSAVVIMPFSLKIVLAPMMERYNYLPMGRRKPWLLFGQLGIFCALLSLSFVPDPLNNMYLITATVLCVHVFIMFQDIATDSLVIDIVPIEQQGKANSFMWGSKTIGTSLSLFMGSWLINHYGFSSAVFTMAIPILCIMLLPLLLRERSGEKLFPWSSGKTSPDAALLAVDSWSKLFRMFRQVIFLKNSLLLLVAVFVTLAALHFMRTLLPVFTIQELTWTNVEYSRIYSFSNLFGGIFGMIVGALIIQRFGVVRLIQGSFCLIILLAIAMASLTAKWNVQNFVTGFIVLFCILLTLINIGVLALAMQLCWKRISAIQFTFCMTIFNAGLAAGAALLGFLRLKLSWQVLFVVFALMILIAMAILNYVKTSRHRQQVDDLENQYTKHQ